MKPTAVRAKTEISNSLPNSTSTVLSLNSSNTINNNISSAASVAASQNSSINSKPLISSTPSKNYQPSAAQILAQNNSNNNSIQSPSTILPTAPIAFSAVAKQNPGKRKGQDYATLDVYVNALCLIFQRLLRMARSRWY